MAEVTQQELTTFAYMTEDLGDHSSPTDTLEFKAVFILLYCIVFCLSFAGLSAQHADQLFNARNVNKAAYSKPL